MNSVVIVGAGGFGREVLEIFKAQNQAEARWQILGFLDDDSKLHGKIMNGYPVIGGVDWLREHNQPDLRCVCAIGTPETRKEAVDRLKSIGATFCNAIHPSVVMSESVRLGCDVVICCGSILTVDIQIGDHVHINLNCTVGHDSIIGSYSTLNPIVAVSGNDVLGEGVYLGTGASLIHEISIGNWATIGAGAVVVHHVPAKVVAVGVPAKVIRDKH